MTDYGHPILFGTLIEPPANRPLDVIGLAELSDGLGLDLVSLSDHPYWPERLDTLTLLAAIAAKTERVRLLTNLANLPLRPPVALARIATTLDLLSGGRFEMGLATGSQQLWHQIVADGGPHRDAAESVAALDEAVHILRTLWAAGGPVHFDGVHYQLDGVPAGPRPAHDIPIWVGAYQPRMLRLVGRLADVWVPSSPFLPPDRIPAANAIIDDAAHSAGRSPAAVRRAYNIDGDFYGGGGFLRGSPASWAEQLTELALTDGMSAFLLYRAETATQIERFAKEVAPEVRYRVAAERKRSDQTPANSRSRCSEIEPGSAQ
ncbi:LLM class flavin-dependent oxidoreductase [Mycobacterium sp. 050134]|uniref:LLM class flavin-dependent oxidoreductase n=1 Tax=Mycobacterium sp. 050134 TaxID=3096111 RepID=UPI002ED7E174